MFISNVSKVAYVDPWNIPLDERIRILSKGRRRVAYFYDEANNSTFRYRAYNMAQVLNSDDGCEVSSSYFFLRDLHLIDRIAHIADVLVICRSLYSHRINQLITRFRNKGKRVLFDIDDLVFDPKYAHLVINTLDLDVGDPNVWKDWFSMFARHGEVLRLCDGAITTNEFLASKLEDYSGLPAKVVPNFLNQEQIYLSEKIYREKQETNFARDEKITVGYFSGSPSHNLDFAIITTALEDIFEKDPRVELMIVGYIEAGAALSKYSERIKYQPFQDYINLQRLVGCVEFNLVPLQSNVFSNCKSELKYFDAAVVGTNSIVSPSYTYSSAIQDGRNGYIAQAHQWASVLSRAIDNMADYSEMAAIAYDDAHSKFSWKTQCESIIQAVF